MNNLKKQDEKFSILSTISKYKKRIGIVAATMVVITSAGVMYDVYATRQANQVAQLNELTNQLIHEQRKVQEKETNVSELKAEVARQKAAVDELTKHNVTLKGQVTDLTKKYREHREALEKKRQVQMLASRGGNINELSTSRENSKKAVVAASMNESKDYDFTVSATFYIPKCPGCSGITASGVRATPGVSIAVDPNYWKLGTKFYVEGFGVMVAHDTGGDIKGKYRFDVCVATEAEAKKLGRKKLKVRVIE